MIDKGTGVQAAIDKIIGGTTDKPSRGVILEIHTAADVRELSRVEKISEKEKPSFDGETAPGCSWLVIIVAVVWLWAIL